MNFLFRHKIKFFIVFLICLLNVNFVHADSLKIAGQGLFTPTITKKEDLCKVDKENKGDFLFGDASGKVDTKQKESFEKLGDVGKDDKTLPEKAVTGIIDNASKSMQDTLFKMDCEKSSVSFATSFVKIAEPVNITSNSLVMKLISVTQYIGLSLSVLFIVVYGFLYQFGNMELDPFKFILRVGATVLTIYFLPYLMQDLLNINNVIVYNIATLPLGATAGDTAQAAGYGLATLGVGVAGAAIGMIGVGLGAGIFIGILALIAVIMLIKPILQILVWWFGRLLMVFALAIFGPILVVGMMLPQTTKFAQKWLKMFVGETFSQVFMTIGGFLVASILGQFGQFSSQVGLGLIDRLIFFYALILFLGTLPQIIAKLIDSGGSSALAKQLSGIGNSVALMASAAGTMAAARHNNNKAKTEGDKVSKQNNDALRDFGNTGTSDISHDISSENVGKLKDTMNSNRNGTTVNPNLGASMQFGAGAGGGTGAGTSTGTGTGAANQGNGTKVNNLSKDVEKDGGNAGNTGTQEQKTHAQQGEASPTFSEQTAEGAGKLEQQGAEGIHTQQGEEGATAQAQGEGQEQGQGQAEIPQENTAPPEQLPQEMLDGVYSGTMDRTSATLGLADKFMADGMSKEGAIKKAQESIQGFENKTGLSWNAQNAMGQLHAMGALNSDRVRQIAHSDFSQRSSDFRKLGKDDQNKIVNDFVNGSNLKNIGSQSANQAQAASLERGKFSVKANGVNIGTGSTAGAMNDIKMKESRADGLVNDFKNGAMGTSLSDSQIAQSYIDSRPDTVNTGGHEGTSGGHESTAGGHEGTAGGTTETPTQDSHIETQRADVEPPSSDDNGQPGEQLEDIFTPTETFDDGPQEIEDVIIEEPTQEDVTVVEQSGEDSTYQEATTIVTGEDNSHQEYHQEQQPSSLETPGEDTNTDDFENADDDNDNGDDLKPFSSSDATKQTRTSRFNNQNKDIDINFDYQDPGTTKHD